MDNIFEINREADSIALIVKTLKQIRDKNLTFENIMENEMKHIKECQELIQNTLDEE